MSELSATLQALRTLLLAFDPARHPGADCAALAEELAATEKACAAARARAAVRVAECGAHHDRGYRDAADWMARAAGTSTGEARAVMETAEAVRACPTTEAAFAAGELSPQQAREIARTEQECPGSEGALIDIARRSSLSALRDAARQRRQAALDPDDLHRRQREARWFRHWRDELGMVRVAGALPPEIGLPIANRLDAETDRVFREARSRAPREPHAALAADAFARLLGGATRGGKGRTDLVIVCDLNAWRRGHALEGEPVHIIGGGPIPVRLAKSLAGDAFLKAVLHDGTAIHTVKHFGRHINAVLRTALDLGTPPGFEGAQCVEPDCDRRYGIEWDHDDPRANGGPTAYANLKPRCRPHHKAKTERDRLLGLLIPRRESADPP